MLWNGESGSTASVSAAYEHEHFSPSHSLDRMRSRITGMPRHICVDMCEYLDHRLTNTCGQSGKSGSSPQMAEPAARGSRPHTRSAHTGAADGRAVGRSVDDAVTDDRPSVAPARVGTFPPLMRPRYVPEREYTFEPET